jgi:hypothetical protein
MPHVLEAMQLMLARQSVESLTTIGPTPRLFYLSPSSLPAPSRELDLKILQEALSREASDEAREAAAREKRAEDVRRYREQLALMIEKVGPLGMLPSYTGSTAYKPASNNQKQCVHALQCCNCTQCQLSGQVFMLVFCLGSWCTRAGC